MTADDKFSLLKRRILRQYIQIHLSEKQKAFPDFFCAFLKFALNFDYFRKKLTLIAYVFSTLRSPKEVVRWMPKKSPLRGALDRQLGKWSKTLIEPQRQHLYHIYWSLWNSLRRNNWLFVTCKMLRLFVNTLKAMTTILFLIEAI